MTLKKMLFLDDCTKRIDSARRQYAGVYDLTVVTNAKECLRYLCRQEWDILSLDHDLGGYDFQDPDDKTSGMEVVRYICKTGWPMLMKVPEEIWIHSSNLFAASLMIDILSEAGIKSYYHRFEYKDEHNYIERKPQISGCCNICGEKLEPGRELDHHCWFEYCGGESK